MRSLLLFMFFSLAGTAVHAADTGEAKKVLDKVATVVGNKNGVEATFAMTNEQLGRISGTIAVKGNKFRATTPAATVWYDGTTQWAYMESTEEVTITTPSAEQQAAMNPLTFINLYKTGYTLSLATVEGQWEVRMQAQQRGSDIQEVYVDINKTTYIPTQVRLRRDNKWTIINISSFTTSPQSDASFVFNAKDYPHAEVVDLR